MPVFKSNSCVFALLWLYILKIEEDAPVFPPSSCSGHLSRCPQVCRGLGIWRCWDPVFWPCLQEPRLSTCTTYRIWWVINQQLFSLCWSYLWWLRLFSRLICLNSSSLFFRLINVKYSLNYVNRKNVYVICQSIPDVPPKPGELRTELLGHKLREEAAALREQPKVDWSLDDVTNRQWRHGVPRLIVASCSSGVGWTSDVDILRMSTKNYVGPKKYEEFPTSYVLCQ